MERLIQHYDRLIAEGNDPFRDPPALKAYMDKWDGEAFLKLLALTPETSALEIGVGTGRLAARVLPRCQHLTGIDLSRRTLERCRENLPDTHLTLIAGDFLTWPFAPQCFDRVYSSLTFWHFQDKRAAVQKAASLLAPGGRLVLSLSRECEERLCCFPGLELPLFPDDPSETLRLMQEAGLRTLGIQETDFAFLLCGQAG